MLEKPDPRIPEIFETWPALPWYAKWRAYLLAVSLVTRARVKSLIARVKP